MKKQVVDSLKVISGITKFETFDGNNFKRWKEGFCTFWNLPQYFLKGINRVLVSPKAKLLSSFFSIYVIILVCLTKNKVVLVLLSHNLSPQLKSDINI